MKTRLPILSALALACLWFALACQSTAPRRVTMLPPRSLWTVTTNEVLVPNEFSPTAPPIERSVEIDLSRSTMLAAASLAWTPESVPSSYSLQVTSDPATAPWVTVATSTTPASGMQLVTFPPTAGRYFRVHVPTADATNPPTLEWLQPISLADRPTASFTFEGTNVPVADPTALFDGAAETTLAAPDVLPDTPVTFDVDLHAPFLVGALRIDWASATNRPASLALSFSMDGAKWTEVGTIESENADASDLIVATRIQPVRFLRFETVSSSGPTNALRSPAFVLANLFFRDSSAASRPWRMYEFAASKAPAALAPRVLLEELPSWTVAVAEGATAEPLISTEGAFAPAASAPSLWPLAVVGTNVYAPSVATSAEFSVPAPGVPLPQATWSFGDGLSLTMRILPMPTVTEDEGMARPLAMASYEWASASTNPLPVRLAWVLRPIRIPSVPAGGGFAFVGRLRASQPDADLTPDLQEMRVNAEPLYATARKGMRFVASDFHEDDISAALLQPPALPEEDSALDRTGLASAAWVLDTVIPPCSTSRTVIASTAPLFDADRLLDFFSKENATVPGLAGTSSSDSATSRRAPRHGPRRPAVPVPAWPATEAEAEATFDAVYADTAFAASAEASGYAPTAYHPKPFLLQRLQLAYMLHHRAADRLVADEQKRIRLDDDIWRFAALLRLGCTDEAGKWLDTLLAAQDPETGAVPAIYASFPLAGEAPAVAAPEAEQAGQHSAHAQMVFACMEYYRFTHDMAFLRRAYPSMRAAMVHLQELRASALPPPPSRWRRLFGNPPPPPPSIGLFPASPAAPDRHPYVHAYWALLGWKELRAAAATLGHAEDVAWADSNGQSIRVSLELSLNRRFDALPPKIRPLLTSAPEPGSMPSPFDAALLVWPVCEPSLVPEHVLQATLTSAYEPFIAAAATADSPAKESAYRAESMRLLLPLALCGRNDYAREILFALTDAVKPAEWGAIPLFFPSGFTDMPSSRAAAHYALALRQILVHEDPSHQVLHLLAGAPPEWLQLGDGLVLSDAPTAYGPVSVAARWGRRRLSVEISGAAIPPGGYRVWWPRQIRPKRVTLDGVPLDESAFDAQGASVPRLFKGTLEAFFEDRAPSPRDF